MTWNLEACRNQLFLKKSHFLDFCYMIIKNDFFFQVKETTNDKTDEPSDVISSTEDNSEKEPSDKAANTSFNSADDEKNPLGGAIVATEKDKEDTSPSKVEKNNEASTSE